MLVLHHFLHVLFTLRGIFMRFSELTYWQDAIVPVPCVLLFCVSEKQHRKYSRNWTNRRPKLLFFPDEGRGPKESRRGARGQPHHEGACPPPGRTQGWWGPPGGPLTPPLRLFKASWSPNPKSIGIFPRTVPHRRRHWRQISGDRSLCSGTLPGQGSAPGAISINAVASSAISIDFTAISTNLAVSYDEEGVVLPRDWGLYR
jgi:hypothetical protein